MVRRSPAPCLVHGCPVLTVNSRCVTHSTVKDRRDRSRRSRTAAQAGYGSAWARKRKAFIEVYAQRDRSGRVVCQGCLLPIDGSIHVDHIERRIDGGSDDPSNLQALHASCHGRKTVKVDGGYGNPRR